MITFTPEQLEEKAREIAEDIDVLVAEWLKKMGMDVSNKGGREVFTQSVARLIESGLKKETVTQ